MIEEELRQKEETLIKLAKMMKAMGKPIDEIIKETGLSKREIEKL